MASKAKHSDMGCAAVFTYDSMAWVRASIPAAAVTLGGWDIVNSGSSIANVGINIELPMPIFRFCSSSVITAHRVTSLEVPAVVGKSTIGNGCFFSLCNPS